MAELTIYHNPRCSKSRQALALLEQKGAAITVVRYLDDPLGAPAIKSLLGKLGMAPRELLRKGEAVYKENQLGDESLSDEALIQAMVETPVLMERPIVVSGDRAVVGRPPETVLELL